MQPRTSSRLSALPEITAQSLSAVILVMMGLFVGSVAIHNAPAAIGLIAPHSSAGR